MAKQPTPQGISALLGRAGFTRSASRSSRVRGWHEHSEGYRVRRLGNDTIEVQHVPHSLRMRNPDKGRVKQMLDRYSETLVAAGYRVTFSDADALGYLVVAVDSGTKEA
jgi:hypothetical protein